MEEFENNQVIREKGNFNNINIYTKTFIYMFMGLLATGIIAAFTYYSGFAMNILGTGTWSLILVSEIVVVLLFTFLFRKLSPRAVLILFLVYSVINGITMSVIFALFELSSILIVFISAAAIFGLCALYGYLTKKDLSKIGTILMFTLIIGIIVSIVNLIFKSSMLDIAIDWFILLVFFGITAWDMQKVKLMAQSEQGQDDKMAIYCAMDLYLDFVNIFLRLLSIFGKRK